MRNSRVLLPTCSVPFDASSWYDRPRPSGSPGSLSSHRVPAANARVHPAPTSTTPATRRSAFMTHLLFVGFDGDEALDHAVGTLSELLAVGQRDRAVLAALLVVAQWIDDDRDLVAG